MCQTQKANYPDVEHRYNDLTSRDNSTAPAVDLYIAGFPCQPFSRSGKQEGFADAKGRGTIFFSILDYIEKQRPSVFVLENIKASTTLHRGSCLNTILADLRKAADGMCNISTRFSTHVSMDYLIRGLAGIV